MTAPKKVVWDLCSGLGGWSEAFLQDEWTVIRIETNEALQYVPHTYQLDVTQWTDWADDLPRPNVILASPPCLEFSTAYNAPKPKAKREGKEFQPDMTIVNCVRDIIQTYDPEWWVVENVNGAITALDPVYGRYKQQVGPFYLWGKFPRIHMPSGWSHSKEDHDVWSTDPLRANKKAMIPFDVSFRLLKAIKETHTLWEWI